MLNPVVHASAYLMICDQSIRGHVTFLHSSKKRSISNHFCQILKCFECEAVIHKIQDIQVVDNCLYIEYISSKSCLWDAPVMSFETSKDNRFYRCFTNEL